MKRVLFFAIIATSVMTSCFKSDTKSTTAVASDTGVIRTIKVPFSTSGSYTLYRLVDSTIVFNADSASSRWDFGMRRATLIFNSASSGPGNAGVILQDIPFSSVNKAPFSGYAFDTSSSQKAIKDYSWYTYNSQTRGFDPIAGKTFVIKTGDGNHFAKIEFLKAEYAGLVGNPPSPTYIIYTFRYFYQANGSDNL